MHIDVLEREFASHKSKPVEKRPYFFQNTERSPVNAKEVMQLAMLWKACEIEFTLPQLREILARCSFNATQRMVFDRTVQRCDNWLKPMTPAHPERIISLSVDKDFKS